MRDVGNGRAGTSIGGGSAQRVDSCGAVRTGEVAQYPSPRLPAGPHTPQLPAADAHDGSSSASFVSVDRAEVFTD